MKLLFLLIGMATTGSLYAQLPSDTLCNCATETVIHYPKEAEKDSLSGTVIIEINEDEACRWSGPIVIQKAGHGFDEEALKAVAIMIRNHNLCASKCKSHICTPRKVKQAIKFNYQE